MSRSLDELQQQLRLKRQMECETLSLSIWEATAEALAKLGAYSDGST